MHGTHRGLLPVVEREADSADKGLYSRLGASWMTTSWKRLGGGDEVQVLARVKCGDDGGLDY